jgi:hypothetical protein
MTMKRRRRRARGEIGYQADPLEAAQRIAEALDDSTVSGKVKALEDMTDEEIAALEKEYGCKVKRKV